MLALLVAPARAQGVNYLLDPAHTRVHWEVMHFGTSTTRGRFDDISGSLTLDEATGQGEVSVSIGTASVNTGVKPLDSVLRGTDYLDSRAHPQAFFVARGWAWKKDAPLEVRGELTLHGVSLPISLRAARLHCAPHPMLLREVCGADLEGEFRRGEFGITDGLPFVGDRVRLLIPVEAIRSAP
ncbi:YceI family protein [Sphaerotilaceae bacterium SBD11-9]